MKVMVEGVQCYQGCDVSKWQGKINYGVFNLDFVIYKATGADGGLYTDGMFLQNAAGFKTVEGPYHFAGGSYDAAYEANYFCDVILKSAWAELDPMHRLPPTLDWEPTRTIPGSGAWVVKFCETVKARTGMTPFIYTGAYVSLDRTPALLSYPLWLAAYTTHPPYCAPWGSNWTMWQHTSSGSVTGIAGGVDSNVFKADQFEKMLGQPLSPQPATPTTPQENDMLNADDIKVIRQVIREELAAEEAQDRYMARDETTGGIYLVNESTNRRVLIPDPAKVAWFQSLGLKGRGPDGAINNDGASLSTIPIDQGVTFS